MRNEGFGIFFSKREQENFNVPPSVSMLEPGELERTIAASEARTSELLEYVDGVPAAGEVSLLRHEYFTRAAEQNVFTGKLVEFLPPTDVVDRGVGEPIVDEYDPEGFFASHEFEADY